MESLIKDKLEKGIPIKSSCRAKSWPYVSVNKALRKYGLAIPRTYAEAKAKASGRAPEATTPAKAPKPRQPKTKAPEPVQAVNPTV